MILEHDLPKSSRHRTMFGRQGNFVQRMCIMQAFVSLLKIYWKISWEHISHLSTTGFAIVTQCVHNIKVSLA